MRQSLLKFICKNYIYVFIKYFPQAGLVTLFVFRGTVTISIETESFAL